MNVTANHAPWQRRTFFCGCVQETSYLKAACSTTDLEASAENKDKYTCA
jgi:hypothetical protein